MIGREAMDSERTRTAPEEKKKMQRAVIFMQKCLSRESRGGATGEKKTR